MVPGEPVHVLEFSLMRTIRKGKAIKYKEPVLTNFFRNFCDCVAGQVQNYKALKASDEVWDLLKSCSVKLPLLNLRELDQGCRKSLKIRICQTL